MDVALHLARPAQKSPQLPPLAPHELPELQKSDLGHFDAGVGFDPPQEIGTPPRSQVVALGGVPEKAQPVAHASMITTKDPCRLGAASALGVSSRAKPFLRRSEGSHRRSLSGEIPRPASESAGLRDDALVESRHSNRVTTSKPRPAVATRRARIQAPPGISLHA